MFNYMIQKIIFPIYSDFHKNTKTCFKNDQRNNKIVKYYTVVQNIDFNFNFFKKINKNRIEFRNSFLS